MSGIICMWFGCWWETLLPKVISKHYATWRELSPTTPFADSFGVADDPPKVGPAVSQPKFSLS